MLHEASKSLEISLQPEPEAAPQDPNPCEYACGLFWVRGRSGEIETTSPKPQTLNLKQYMRTASLLGRRRRRTLKFKGVGGSES